MKKILAIDDQKNNLIAIEALLNNLMPDCKVLTALSGKEGIEIAGKEQPDTILLDIIMPQMDGYEVCKKLKKDELTKHIPVLMFSAIKTDTESRVKGLDVGADAFLQKPIDPAELTAQVNVMLRIKEAEDKLRAEKELLDEKVKEKTEELRESERQLQAIFDDPDTFIGILDLDGSLLRANKAALKFINSTNSELRGIKFWETPWWIHSKDLQEKLKSGIIKAGKGEIVRFEAEHYNNDGKQIFVDFTMRPVRNSQDKIYRFIVEGINISKRKQAEYSLRESEERFRQIVERSSDVFYYQNIKTKKFEYVSPKIFDLLGYKPKELKGMGLKEQKAQIHPDDLPKLTDFSYDIIEADNKGEGYIEREFRLMNKYGDYLWVHGNYTLIRDGKGKPHLIVGSLHNITKRKQAEDRIKESEEKLRNFVEFTPLGIWCFQPEKPVDINISEDQLLTESFNSICVECNDTYASMMGVSKEEILGLKLSDAMPDTDENRNYLRAFIKNGFKLSGGISRELTKDGEEKYFSNSLVGVIKNGKLINAWGTQTDVTARMRAEKALKKSEEKYRKLIETTSEGVWLISSEKKTIDVNQSLCNMLGYSRNEMIGKPPFDFVDEANRKIFTEQIMLSKSIKHRTYEISLKRKNGINFPTLFNATSLIEKNGEHTGSFAFITDITGKKKAEIKLSESEKKYRDLFEKSEDAILIIHNGKFVDCNQATIKMLRYNKKDEFLNIHPSELSPEKQPDGKMSFTKANDMMKIAYENGSHRFEWYHKKSDGEIFPVEVLLTAISIDKKDQILHTIWRDITNRKHAEEALVESEEKFRNITASAQDAIVMMDNDGNISYWNEAAEKMFGHTKEEAIGKEVHKLIAPAKYYNDFLKGFEVFRKTGKGPIVGKTFEITGLNKNGIEIPIELSNSVVKLKGKWNATAIIRDITKRKKTEQELKENEKHLKELNTSKDKFFAIIGHDLLNPFGLVMSAADELSTDYDNYDEEDRKKLIEIISKDSKHAMNLLQNLLEWSRSQRGLIKYDPEIFFIKEIIDENIRLLKENADIKQIKIGFNIPPTLIVYADKNMISTIIRNLLSNAIKFTEKGTIFLSYEIKDNKLHISVVDSGIGIEKQLIDKLFKIDERISTVGTSGERGTGLGLQLCNDFININKGEIWIESTVDKGSKFTFSVPIKP